MIALLDDGQLAQWIRLLRINQRRPLVSMHSGRRNSEVLSRLSARVTRELRGRTLQRPAFAGLTHENQEVNKLGRTIPGGAFIFHS